MCQNCTATTLEECERLKEKNNCIFSDHKKTRVTPDDKDDLASLIYNMVLDGLL